MCHLWLIHRQKRPEKPKGPVYPPLDFAPMIRRDGNSFSLFFVVRANSEKDYSKEQNSKHDDYLLKNEEVAATIEICYREIGRAHV